MNSSIFNLKNIKSSYFFKIENNFRIELFKKCLKASGKWKSLAKIVGYSPKNNINFNHPKKMRDLNTVLESYKLFCYKPNQVFNKILAFLSSGPKNTEEVANKKRFRNCKDSFKFFIQKRKG